MEVGRLSLPILTAKKKRMKSNSSYVVLTAFTIIILLVLYKASFSSPACEYEYAPVLVSYSYFQKDEIQLGNFEFIIHKAFAEEPILKDVHWSFVIGGTECSPCKLLGASSQLLDGPEDLGIRSHSINPLFTVIFRLENVGMDIGAHNATLSLMKIQNKLWSYKYFFFLNSSIKGPFYPSYMPQSWHWTHAFLERMKDDVHAVGSSLVCLPQLDAGGPGPRLESWAYALDQQGLTVAMAAGVYEVRSCKHCVDDSGIIVGGEYALTTALFKADLNIATLMSRYAQGIDWRDPLHWRCNNNVHPSRHGTYDGIAFHPYETVFVKSSWHVADPYTARYTKWVMQHIRGDPGSGGYLDAKMYRYAISPLATKENPLELAYNVSYYRPL